MPREESQQEIEAPLRKFPDGGGGAMRKKILYIRSYLWRAGANLQTFAVDSVISMMHAGGAG